MINSVTAYLVTGNLAVYNCINKFQMGITRYLRDRGKLFFTFNFD